TASSVDKLTTINEAARKLGKRAKIHLKIDTGMERIGTHYYSAEKLLRAATEASCCDTIGVYSHFATADSADLSFAREQLTRFKEVVAFYPRNGMPTPMLHIANSGAVLQLPESALDMVRPGICLYGAFHSEKLPDSFDFKPVLSLTSSVV